MGDIVDLLRKKQYGKFDKINATNIASALWSYKNTQEPSSIINLANSIESMWSPNYKASASDKNLLESFNKISDVSSLRRVGKQAQQSLTNDANILKEQFQFAKGDTDIQSGFGMYSPEVQKEFEKTQESSDDIKKLADSFESSLSEDKKVTVLSEEEKQLESYNDLSDSIKDDKNELSNLESLGRKGFEINEDRVKQLSIDIDENIKEQNKMYSLSKKIQYKSNINKNIESIDLLAENILEENELESTVVNLSVAKQRAADIIRQVPVLQFTQSASGFGKQRAAYDTQGRIKR